MEQPSTINHELQVHDRRNGSSNSSSRGSGTNGPHIEVPLPLKSNLKKTALVEENQVKIGRRKVSWPDAHGKDIAHVQEFEPSMLEDGEFEGVQNSCICAIQ